MAGIKGGSRYTNGLFTTGSNNRDFMLLRKTLVMPESDQDSFVIVEGHFVQRLDLLSQRVYDRPDLGWVIMDVNNIVQPLFDLQVGQVLRVPPLLNVLDAIEKLNK